MNRTYEVMYIVRPDMEEADLEKLIEGFNTVVTNGGGEVNNIEKLGRRRLAYIVRKFQDGMYILLHIRRRPAGPRTGAPPARYRAGHQVHHRPHGRGEEAPGKVKALRDACKKAAPAPAAAAAPAAP